MTGTRIGTHPNDAERLRLRGHDTLTEVIGEMTFTEGFYLVVTGRRPTGMQLKVFDAALLLLMDHGLTPSALVARLVADSNRDDDQIALAAGLLMVGNRFVGTMTGAGRILAEGMAAEGDKAAWAQQLVQNFKNDKRRIPGFGHQAYKEVDPRSARIFEVAQNAGVKGDYIRLVKTLSAAVNADARRSIPLNATGALAAVLHEIDFPTAGMRAVAAVGRCAGLAGHIQEERELPIAPLLTQFSESIAYED
ncbi:MAG TPA: citryl-CoA lyase [Bosea sp. (in: a-proteobacteria)]